jgi:superfamily I DNA and/or RNA helicase
MNRKAILNEIDIAIQEEVASTKSKYKKSPLYISDFKPLGTLGPAPYYFQAVVDVDESGLSISEGVEIRIFWSFYNSLIRMKDEEMVEGTLLVYDPSSSKIICSAQRRFFPPNNSSIKIEPQSHKLLYIIRDNIKRIDVKGNLLVWQILQNHFSSLESFYPIYGADISGMSPRQAEALIRAFKQDITYVWGPPGTGKTQTLAKIIIEMMKLGKKILVTAISNVAVDQLGLRTEKLLDSEVNFNPFLLRYGYARLPEARKSPKLYPNKSRIIQKRTEIDLVEEAIKTEGSFEMKAVLKQKLASLQQELKKLTTEPILHADTTFTTAIQAALEDTFKEVNYDVVIVDEASMMSVGHVSYLASLAREKIIIAGDFQQLSPIAISSHYLVTKWLKTDPFTLSGISQTINHSLLVMLDEQRRMHEDIAKIISASFYSNKLKTLISEKNRIGADFEPNSGEPIVFWNLNDDKCNHCQKTDKGSRYNKYSAELCVEIAKRIARSAKYCTVGIITPYRAQSQIIKRSITDLRLHEKQTSKIKVGTVHAFQGDESDVILFDMVDTKRVGPGTLYKGETGLRLLNVAISRAKGKIVMIGEKDLFSEDPDCKKLDTIIKKFF